MQSLGNIIGDKGRQSSLMRGVAGLMAGEEANKLLISIFGETAKNSCQVISVKNEIITIACLDSDLESQIKLREEEIIIILNKKLGEGTVKKIRFLE